MSGEFKMKSETKTKIALFGFGLIVGGCIVGILFKSPKITNEITIEQTTNFEVTNIFVVL